MKTLLVILGVLAALAVAAFIALQFFLGSIVTAGVNNIAPKITQTSVVLSSASISPLNGSGTLTGLTVGNPKGWSGDKAFYLGSVHLDVQPFSIFGDHIVINEIVIEQPEIYYETKVIASNVGDLLKNIEAATGGKEAGAQPTAKNGKAIKFEVKKFVLRDAKVHVGVGTAGIPLPMPTITLTDLGTKEGGITPDQLTFAVMRSVTTGVVGATVQAAANIGSTGGAAAVEGVKKTGEALKGIFGGKK